MKITVKRVKQTTLTIDVDKIASISGINNGTNSFILFTTDGIEHEIVASEYNNLLAVIGTAGGGGGGGSSEYQGMPVIETTERILTLEPNKYYIFGECASLDITLGEPTTNGKLNEYIFEFNSGATPTALTLPNQITPIENLSPDTKYIISIRNNIVEKIENPSREVDNVLRKLLNKMLITIDIPEGVISIPQYFFYNHIRLTEVTLPSTLTKIEQYAFQGCNALVSSINLPEGFTTIERDAFYGCVNLQSITFPSTLTTIATEAFRNCTLCQFSQIPNSVTTIGTSAFNNCKGITSMIIPNSIVTLEGSVFATCTNMRSVSLPNTIVTIANQAFDGCSNLIDITMYDSITTLSGGQTFRGINANCKVRIYGTNRVIPFLLGSPAAVKFYVDDSMVQAYKTNSAWSARASYIYSLNDYTP